MFYEFFLNFFMNIFSQLHILVLNYWSLSYVSFSLFFLFSYSKTGLVKLTKVGFNIFYWTLICPSFKSLFFLIPVSNDRLVELTWVNLISFPRFFYGLNCFLWFHHFALNYLLWSFDIFSLFFLFHYFESGLVKLI
jgi:hypothetical protein